MRWHDKIKSFHSTSRQGSVTKIGLPEMVSKQNSHRHTQSLRQDHFKLRSVIDEKKKTLLPSNI